MYRHLTQHDSPLRPITGAIPLRRATSSADCHLSRSLPTATSRRAAQTAPATGRLANLNRLADAGAR